MLSAGHSVVFCMHYLVRKVLYSKFRDFGNWGSKSSGNLLSTPVPVIARNAYTSMLRWSNTRTPGFQILKFQGGIPHRSLYIEVYFLQLQNRIHNTNPYLPRFLKAWMVLKIKRDVSSAQHTLNITPYLQGVCQKEQNPSSAICQWYNLGQITSLLWFYMSHM